MEDKFKELGGSKVIYIDPSKMEPKEILTQYGPHAMFENGFCCCGDRLTWADNPLCMECLEDKAEYMRDEE